MPTPPAPSYEALAEENRRLRAELAALRNGGDGSTNCSSSSSQSHQQESPRLPLPPLPSVERLSAAQISRYSRQLLVPALGVEGQKRLLQASVLIVGAGGLGSSALLYLAAAGVGRLGIVDHDRVEASNLHRQVIHAEGRAGWKKVDSAAAAIRALNSGVELATYDEPFTPANAARLVAGYDLVLDASDNPATRYLLNDACVLLPSLLPGGSRRRRRAGRRVPLVSGAAVGAEGQVTVYNLEEDGPCYRCIYPTPLPAAASGSCADQGVLGVVPGVIGCLQAMEAIKALLLLPDDPPTAPPPPARNPSGSTSSGVRPLVGRLLHYDALRGAFLSLDLPKARNSDCLVCGCPSPSSESTSTTPGLTAVPALANRIRSMEESGAWAAAAGIRGPSLPGQPSACAATTLPFLPPEAQVTCEALAALLQQQQGGGNPADGDASPPLLLDVRDPVQFAICALPGAHNLPFPTLKRILARRGAGGGGGGAERAAAAAAEEEEDELLARLAPPDRTVYVVCRRGVLSTHATRLLLDHGWTHVCNVQGGLTQWHHGVDPAFPLY